MKIHHAFRSIRKSKKLSQGVFKGIVGRCGVSRFESGTADLSSSKLVRCLELMGATFSDVFAATQVQEGLKTYMPVYKWGDLRFKRRKPTHYITYLKGASNYAYALTVKDESMISNVSAFPIGSTIIVEPTGQANDGDLVIVKKRTIYYFRRYVSGFAVPDNNAHEIIEKPIIIGRVVGATWTI